ncbi:MAG: tetratricopeptide repeat protein [Caldilineaceae bacterium]
MQRTASHSQQKVDHRRFGALLRHYRTRQDVSQNQLAELIDLTPSNISRWEAAKRKPPDRATVLALGDALSLEPREINLLLAAAGYMQVEGGGIDFGDPLLRSLATTLAGDYEASSLGLLRRQLEELLHIWSSTLKFAGEDIDSAPNDVDYESLLDRSFELHTLTRLPILAALGDQRARQSQFLEARVWYERAKDAAALTGERRWSAEMSVQIGNILRTLGQREALVHYQAAESGFSAINDRLGVARCRRKQASVYLYLGIETAQNAERAQQLLRDNVNELFSMRRSAPDRNIAVRTELFNTYSYLGWLQSLQGNSEEGIELRRQALELARSLNDHYRLSVGHRLLGDDCENHGDLDEAEAHYRSALEQCRLIDSPVRRARELGKVERGLGATLTRQARYDEAAEHLNESLAIFRAAEDDLNLAWTLNELGKLHAARGSMGRALDAHWVARAVFETIGNDYYSAGAGLDLAEIHCLQGDVDQALALAQQSRRIAAERGHRRLLARAQECSAYYLLLREAEYSNARILYDTFFDTVMEIGAMAEHAERLVQRAEHLLSLQRYADVQELAAHLMVRCQEDEDDLLVQSLRSSLDACRRRADMATFQARKPVELDDRLAAMLSPGANANTGVEQ